ncbi:MAG: sigma 54-interacting transcriptional regulator [Sandaracinaceae bacterium]
MPDESTLTTGGPMGGPPTVGDASLQVFLPECTWRVPLVPGGDIVLGRAAEADIPLHDPSVSRRHAVIRWKGAALWIEDCESRNGTFVNMREVERTQLRLGDRIEIGDVVAIVRGGQERFASQVVAYDDIEPVIEAELAEARETGRELTLALFEATGHERHLSVWLPSIEKRLRDEDIIASFGTESLIVLMPGVSEQDGARLARAMNDAAPAKGVRVIHATVPFPGPCSRGDDLLDELARRLEARRAGSPSAASVAPQDGAVVRTPEMREVYELAERIARSDATTLIQGETGSGKELIAEFIHQRSRRADGPLVKVNCGAIAPTLVESTLFGHERGAFTGADRAHEGLFERANGGTLFLDEVGELSLAAQAALLRAIETGTLVRVGGTREVSVDVRILAATHRDLRKMTDAGTFRLDLMFRINTFTVAVPPLRARRGEIVPLAEEFMERASRAHGRSVSALSPETVLALETYDWPGNVRELRNAIERAVVMSRGERVEVSELPPSVQPAHFVEEQSAKTNLNVPFRDRVRRFEASLMMRAMEESDGNKTAAAKRLNMPLRTFMSKWSSYGLGDEE